MALEQTYWLSMSFKDRLVVLRKKKQLTQKALSEQVGVNVVQIRRYEGGGAQPTLEVIRKLAIALSVSADALIFDKDERGPDDDLRLQFEALQNFTPEEKQAAKMVLEGLILKHDSGRFNPAS